MRATGVKFKGYRCFQDEFAGFDEFKPINIIIGRNHVGKSHLLKLVEYLTEDGVVGARHQLPFQCGVQLQDDFLRRLFPPGQQSAPFVGDLWHSHGANLVGQHLQADMQRGQLLDARFVDAPAQIGPDHRATAIELHLKRIVESRGSTGQEFRITSPLAGRRFLWLKADRDLRPERQQSAYTLEPDGRGGTNLIRGYFNDQRLDFQVLTVGLLARLNDIVAPDLRFRDIRVRHDEAGGQPDAEWLWEIELVEDDGRAIPLSSCGSGLKTILLVLANTLLESVCHPNETKEIVLALEELENNLHPSMLRQLLKYVEAWAREKDDRYVFLTTHSSVVLDYFADSGDAQIIRVEREANRSTTRTISKYLDHLSVVRNLGGRGSDLLQANGIVWVEGPSDRIYLNKWIELASNGELREGRHYQCMYYGGSNLANVTVETPDDGDADIENLINLLPINPNVVVVCDSDKTSPRGKLKPRVERIRYEVEKLGHGYIWVTKGNEIESYVPGAAVKAAFSIEDDLPDPEPFQKYFGSKDRMAAYFSKLDRYPKVPKSSDKVEWARRIAPNMTVELMKPMLDWGRQMKAVVDKIRSWNERIPSSSVHTQRRVF